MSAVLHTFSSPTRAKGDLYWPRALGGIAADGRWEGWIEFVRAGDDAVLRSGRETIRPGRADLVRWAEGLTPKYLERALLRALRRMMTTTETEIPISVAQAPVYPAPSPEFAARVPFDPFQTYAKGEQLLWSQLTALSREQLFDLIDAYSFVPKTERDRVWTSPDFELADRIVQAVRARLTPPWGMDIRGM
jgi:hypothetical protein